MRVTLGFAFAIAAGGASAQNSTTTCYPVGGVVQCNTQGQGQMQRSTLDWGAFQRQQEQIQQEQQQQVLQNIDRLKAAEDAERQRREQENRSNQIQAAIASDQAPALPAPQDEKPVLLACTVERVPGTLSLALFEKHARVDVTGGGAIHSRDATFTNDSVTWNGSVWRSEISRLTLSYTAYGSIPAVAGVVLSGTCQLAQRQF